MREHAAHWEAGAKQNFDTGLYDSYRILYISVEDYGEMPLERRPLPFLWRVLSEVLFKVKQRHGLTQDLLRHAPGIFAPTELTEYVTHLGAFNFKGRLLDILVSDGGYEDEDGTDKAYLDDCVHLAAGVNRAGLVSSS